MKKLVLFALMSISITAFSQSLTGATYSYTERVFTEEGSVDVTSYFTFTSETDVVWLFETPRENVFPVGYGKYSKEYNTIFFSHLEKVHEKISIYYAETDIKFTFDPTSLVARLLINHDHSHDYLNRFYNQGNVFRLTKEKVSLVPNKNLVGTSWGIYDANNDVAGTLYFKTWNEVLINGETHLYVCVGNLLAIKSGDNLNDENLVGIYYPGARTIICKRDGLDKEEWNNDLSISFEIVRLE